MKRRWEGKTRVNFWRPGPNSNVLRDMSELVLQEDRGGTFQVEGRVHSEAHNLGREHQELAHFA